MRLITGSVRPIVTERLILREFEPSDASRYIAMETNPQVTRWLGTPPPTTQPAAVVARRDFEKYLFTRDVRGFTTLAVELRATGEFIGYVGIIPLPMQGARVPIDGTDDNPSQPARNHLFEHSIYDRAELFYVLDEPAWGHGYATEAGSGMLEYATKSLKLPEIYAIVLPQNPASASVLSKLGFEQVGTEGRYDLYRRELEPKS